MVCVLIQPDPKKKEIQLAKDEFERKENEKRIKEIQKKRVYLMNENFLA